MLKTGGSKFLTSQDGKMFESNSLWQMPYLLHHLDKPDSSPVRVLDHFRIAGLRPAIRIYHYYHANI